MTTMSKLIDRIISVTGYGAAYSVVLAMLITCYDVVARYAFNSPTLFAYDSSRWIYYYATLLMAPWVLRNEKHIRIDFLFILLRRERTKALLNFGTSILVIVACSLLLYQGTLATIEDITSQMQTNTVIRIPRFLLFMGIPICAFLLLCEAIRKAKASFLEVVSFIKGKE